MVRLATLEELDAIIDLAQRVFTRPWPTALWHAEIEAGEVFVIGAPILGFACARIVRDRCELRRLVVDASARRTGQGRALLARVIDSARAAGCARIQLEVGTTNTAAVALYRSSGFEVAGYRRGYYDDPPDDALLMVHAIAEDPKSTSCSN